MKVLFSAQAPNYQSLDPELDRERFENHPGYRDAPERTKELAWLAHTQSRETAQRGFERLFDSPAAREALRTTGDNFQFSVEPTGGANNEVGEIFRISLRDTNTPGEDIVSFRLGGRELGAYSAFEAFDDSARAALFPDGSPEHRAVTRVFATMLERLFQADRARQGETAPLAVAGGDAFETKQK